MIDDAPDETPKDEQAPEGAVPEEASAEETAVEEDAPAADEEVPVAAEEEAPAAAEEDAPAADEEVPVAAEEEAPAAAEEEVPAAAEEEAPAAAEEEAPAAAEEEAPGAAEAPAANEGPTPKRSKRERKQDKADEPEAIPGAHLEPDLVLEDSTGGREGVGGLVGAEIEAAERALQDEDGEAPPEEVVSEAPAAAPAPTTLLDLASDARYSATGKRKRAVARVILKPGTGVYTVNGREMNAFFPRPTLQTIVRQPLQTVGHEERMDVVAKIHGGGVSAQAGALRHGISKALTDADPNLRGELKSRGFLTRDPRVKERKKAGLKKARKRPQFSKR